LIFDTNAYIHLWSMGHKIVSMTIDSNASY